MSDNIPQNEKPFTLNRFVIAIFIIQLFAQISFGEETKPAPKIVWPPDGVVINDSPGGSTQKNPKVINSGIGYITVWEDSRAGYFNIYAQRIGENGLTEWGNDGFLICEAPKNQSLPQVVSDGAGGAIIIWEDYRSGHSDIYAQRIDSLGTVQWKKDGIPICSAKDAQLHPKAISDSAGGAVITWYDYRGGKGEDIYAQRVDGEGKVLWQKDGIPISVVRGTQWYPQIAPDGEGGAIIVWTDFRGGSASDIYAQRILSSGKTMWATNGLPISAVAENQADPEIAYNGFGAVIIIWEDYRNRNFDIYSQKIKISGEIDWEKDGIAISKSVFNEEEPHIVSDGMGGVIVVWKERRIKGSILYAQKIGIQGRRNWGEVPKVVSKEKGRKNHISLLSTKRGGAIIAWEDYRTKNSDIYIQKISSTGIPLWEIGGLPLAQIDDNQENPQVVSNGQNGAVIVWQDKRFGNYDIYTQRIESAGTQSWDYNGIIVNASIGSVAQQGPVLGRDSLGDYIIVWEDGRAGYTDIYAQKVNDFGTSLWDPSGMPVCTAEEAQRNPKIVIEGINTFVTWQDYRQGTPKIYIQQLGYDGKPLYKKDGLPVSISKFSQIRPEIVSDGDDGVIIFWQEQHLEKRRYDIFSQRIDSHGNLLWGKSGKEICTELSDQEEPKAIKDEDEGAIVVWTDYRSGLRNSDIYAQRINILGNILWESEGIRICTAADTQRDPQIARSGNGAIIVWTDKGGGGYDIYGQRINSDGETLWKIDGIPICQESGTQREPRIVKNGAEGAIVVWEDYCSANWDIYSQRVDKDGKLLWPSPGVPVTTASATQYAPDIVASSSGGAIVTWEDYRSSLGYKIYAQKIENDGKVAWQENGIPICNLAGGQRNPKIVENGTGGAVITWEDYRGGGYGIYAQRIRIINLQ